METVEAEIKAKTELYDEDGYSIASLEEALAEERAGLGRSFSSREEMIKTLQWEIDNEI